MVNLWTMTTSYVAQGQELDLVVAANVRARAARLGLNASRLARELGMAQSSCNERWRGVRPWQLTELDKLARILEVEPGQLLARSEGLEPPTFWLGVAALIARRRAVR